MAEQIVKQNSHTYFEWMRKISEINVGCRPLDCRDVDRPMKDHETCSPNEVKQA